MMQGSDTPTPQASAAGTYPVAVSNVAPTATDETLRDFFSFAGPVHAVELAIANEETLEQKGTVAFLTAAAAETAVLLDGALIVDRPLTIKAVLIETTTASDPLSAPTSTASTPAAAAATPLPAGTSPLESAPPPATAEPASSPAAAATPTRSIAHDDSRPPPAEAGWATEAVPDPRRRAGPPPSQPSASFDDGMARSSITGLLDAGYTLGSRALEYMKSAAAEVEEVTGIGQVTSEYLHEGKEMVKAFDEAHQITSTIKAFDEQHQVTETASALLSTTIETGKAAVETATPLAISAAQVVREQAEILTERAKEDPTVGPAIEQTATTLSSGWATVTGFVSETWASYIGGGAAEADAPPAPPPPPPAAAAPRRAASEEPEIL